MKPRYSKQAKKFMTKQGEEIEARIRRAVNKLPLDDVVKLSGVVDTYRLCVGDYRIIFIKEGNSISVQKIDNRGQVY